MFEGNNRGTSEARDRILVLCVLQLQDHGLHQEQHYPVACQDWDEDVHPLGLHIHHVPRHHNCAENTRGLDYFPNMMMTLKEVHNYLGSLHAYLMLIHVFHA